MTGRRFDGTASSAQSGVNGPYVTFPFTMVVDGMFDPSQTGAVMTQLNTGTGNWTGHYLQISSSGAQAISAVNSVFAQSGAVPLFPGTRQLIVGVFLSATSRQCFVTTGNVVVPGTIDTTSSNPSIGSQAVGFGASVRFTIDNFAKIPVLYRAAIYSVGLSLGDIERLANNADFRSIGTLQRAWYFAGQRGTIYELSGNGNATDNNTLVTPQAFPGQTWYPIVAGGFPYSNNQNPVFPRKEFYQFEAFQTAPFAFPGQILT